MAQNDELLKRLAEIKMLAALTLITVVALLALSLGMLLRK